MTGLLLHDAVVFDKVPRTNAARLGRNNRLLRPIGQANVLR